MENVKLNINKQENLETLSKNELIEKIKILEAHNVQLKNILNKKNDPKTEYHHKNKKSFDFSKAYFRHVLLKFYYLGWDYDGYVVQEDTLQTIENYLFKALITTCLIKDRQSSNYHRCGRTDKGVSSFSQVISIDLRSKFPVEQQYENIDKEMDYCDILNRVLPDSIRCICWCPVANDMSARFDCKSRTYKYFFPKGDLDIDAMQKASTYLIGMHDFRNFCKMDVRNGVVSFNREIKSASIDKCKDTTNENSAYDMYELTLTGKAYLWHQVRCIMSVLFLIGQKKEKPEIIKELLDIDKNPRKPEYFIANEIGLNLFCCDYELLNNWVYKSNDIERIIKKLYGIWSINSIKSTMIKTMLQELEEIYKNMDNQIDYKELSSLCSEDRSKKYKPLLERQKCDALENRIEHYVKKRKLVIKSDEENGPSTTKVKDVDLIEGQELLKFL